MRTKLLACAAFAVAFAYVEASVVVYLREVYDIRDLVRDMPTRADRFTGIELGREFFTLVMLAGLGWAAGRNVTERLGLAVLAFGVWDIAYYFWLGALIGWPATPLEWDVLFLLPLPWWGPVLAPVLIAAVMVVTGAMAARRGARGLSLDLGRPALAVATIGALVILYTFMADALAALPEGDAAVRAARPSEYNWALYAVGLALLSLPAFLATWPLDVRPVVILRRGAAPEGAAAE